MRWKWKMDQCNWKDGPPLNRLKLVMFCYLICLFFLQEFTRCFSHRFLRTIHVVDHSLSAEVPNQQDQFVHSLVPHQSLCSCVKKYTVRLILTSVREDAGKSLTVRKPRRDFRLQTSDFRLQTSDFRLQISDFRLQTSDFGLQTSAFRLQTSDFAQNNSC